MHIFPIYESGRLFNKKVDVPFGNPRLSEYIHFSVKDVDFVICFCSGVAINVRIFTDKKEFNKFLNLIKKSYEEHEENKDFTIYCEYPKENIPF